MLKPNYYTDPSEFDQLMFEKLVQAEHYLLKVKALFDFESMRALVADCYSADTSRVGTTWWVAVQKTQC